MEEKYTITLSNGRVISDLTLNGNNYVSNEPVPADMYAEIAENCSPMTVSCGDISEVHEHAKLVQVAEYGGKYYLAFRDLTEQEVKEAKLRADIDYLAMMTDTELEEE